MVRQNRSTKGVHCISFSRDHYEPCISTFKTQNNISILICLRFINKIFYRKFGQGFKTFKDKNMDISFIKALKGSVVNRAYHSIKVDQSFEIITYTVQSFFSEWTILKRLKTIYCLLSYKKNVISLC